MRPLLESDSAALAALLSLSSGLATTAARAAERLRASRGVEHPYLAEIAGEPAGFASLRLIPYLGDDRPYAEVSELFVHERCRRQGVAAALLAALAAHARGAGAAGMAVISDEQNVGAMAAYRRRGMAPFALALQAWFTEDRPYELADR